MMIKQFFKKPVVIFSLSFLFLFILFIWLSQKYTTNNTNLKMWKLLNENNCVFYFQWMNYISDHCLSEYFFKEENKIQFDLKSLENIYTKKNYEFEDHWEWLYCWINIDNEIYINPSCLNPNTSEYYKDNKLWYFKVIKWKLEENSVCNSIWEEHTIREWNYIYKMSVCN